MNISKIESGDIFKKMSGINISDSKFFFYFSTEKEKYLEVYDLLVEVVNFYGKVNAIGFGKEYNPYNRSKLIIDKIGYFGQYNFKGFSKSNKLNRKFLFKGEIIYFSYYIGEFGDQDTFYSLIHNKTNRIYLEIIEKDFDSEMELKEHYIGLNSNTSVRILFGFDIYEELYLIFIGEESCIEKIRNYSKSKNILMELQNKII
ncbi:hypothetical protein QDS06_00305 [Acinetobacter baumannii]|uniref:hypothetical protein n=1 Tax=Acinetobacter baumannii TaxID=470 RepID=UPI0009273BAE|nr:hypothetical protein [Acinetobacter baumannii]MDH2622581.1 hypothetical protein [Acinetobacter baumannii]OJK07037.1 hypothetical protein BRY75_09925 [Acinetobacter baumannii]